MAVEDACEHDILVQIRWQERKMAVPLSQLEAINPGQSAQEAIGDWHYWVAQGYCLWLAHGCRKLTNHLPSMGTLRGCDGGALPVSF